MIGKIIETNSHIYVVELENKEKIKVKPEGKIKLSVKKLKAGDNVEIKNDQITKVYERKNELTRPPVANVDYIYLVISAKNPDFSFYLLDLFIAYVESKNLKPRVIVTKIDLLKAKELEDLKQELKYYKEELDINIYYQENVWFKENSINILMGQTGAGKSTLLNKLNKNLNIKTNEISKALNRGKHTTRNIKFYEIKNSYIADTPGFSSLELDIEQKDLKKYFKEFKNDCYFKDCNHLENSKGCKILNNPNIKESRYENYIKIYRKLGDKKWS